jgi:hypothetical protein
LWRLRRTTQTAFPEDVAALGFGPCRDQARREPERLDEIERGGLAIEKAVRAFLDDVPVLMDRLRVTAGGAGLEKRDVDGTPFGGSGLPERERQ